MHEASIARECLPFAAPFFVVAGSWWLIKRTDWIINRLFPHLEWEKSLGWLNIRAERRANAALRWIGHGVHALLASTLPGIVWATVGFRAMDGWPNPWSIGEVMLRIVVLGFCLGVWMLYLGGWLMPKWRAQREEAELKRYRAEAKEAEREREREPCPRIHSPLPKPRANAPEAALVRERRRLNRR